MNLNPWKDVNKDPRKAEDPDAAVAIWTLGVVTALALIAVSVFDVFHDHSGWREAILKGAGGILLLGGSYYGARTLTQGRADQRANRALKAIEFMGHKESDVQKAGCAMLQSMAGERANSPADEVDAMIAKVLEDVPSCQGG